MRCVVEEEPGRYDGPEGAAADNDCVETAWPSSHCDGRAIEGLLQRIAKKAAHVIERKTGFRNQTHVGFSSQVISVPRWKRVPAILPRQRRASFLVRVYL